MREILEDEFLHIAREEGCRAPSLKRQIKGAVSPKYFQYEIASQELFAKKIYPLWRTDRDATHYIEDYRIPKECA